MNNDPPSDDDIESLLRSIEKSHAALRPSAEHRGGACSEITPALSQRNSEERHSILEASGPNQPDIKLSQSSPYILNTLSRDELLRLLEAEIYGFLELFQKNQSDTAEIMGLKHKISGIINQLSTFEGSDVTDRNPVQTIHHLLRILDDRKAELIALERKFRSNEGKSISLAKVEHYKLRAMKMKSFIEAEIAKMEFNSFV